MALVTNRFFRFLGVLARGSGAACLGVGPWFPFGLWILDVTVAFLRGDPRTTPANRLGGQKSILVTITILKRAIFGPKKSPCSKRWRVLRVQIADYAEEEGFWRVQEGNSGSRTRERGARVGTGADPKPQVPTPEPDHGNCLTESNLTGAAERCENSG